MGARTQVHIKNPIINSPFIARSRQFAFDEFGITSQIVDGRRPSSHFIPIAGAKRSKDGQLPFETEWTRDRADQVPKEIREFTKDATIGVVNTYQSRHLFHDLGNLVPKLKISIGIRNTTQGDGV